VNRFFKRIVDIFIALPAIVILLPVFAVIFVAVKLTSKGPAIFKQNRAGLNGEPFVFYKFRTMILNVDPFGPSPKSGDDPRLTKIGRFLREHSLDELPQVYNVLKGEMSIVGPRPLYISQMAEWDQRQKKRLLVKPGITGLAQISGRGHLTREEKLELDVKYVEAASFLADIKTVMATIGQVLGREGIYERRYSKTEYTRTKGK
jgi:undecaprenyl phosphate N,N'-diacetylbacillosamine 1-phosphate transferase